MRRAPITSECPRTWSLLLARTASVRALAAGTVLCTLLACQARYETAPAAEHKRAGTAGQTPTPRHNLGCVTFSGTVVTIEYLAQYEGQAIPASVDPKFVLSVALSADAPELGARAGDRLHLAIHSVVRTFLDPDDVVGQPFVFCLYPSETRPSEFVHCAARPPVQQAPTEHTPK